MTSMEDLISAISCEMHVSQDGYDLKALQDYLARTIVLPNLPTPMSPSTAFHQLPPSRSTSSTRRPNSLPQSYFAVAESSSQAHTSYPYPSPAIDQSYFHASAEDVTAALQHQQRPKQLRRTSSYGFGGMKDQGIPVNAGFEGVPPSPGPGAFESDAFAPLWQRQLNHRDPWGRTRSPAEKPSSHNPWAAFNGHSSSFGFQQQQAQPPSNTLTHVHVEQVDQPDRMDEDDMMDEDMAEDGMGEDLDDEDSVEREMGMGWKDDHGGGAVEMPIGRGGWERGRRKD